MEPVDISKIAPGKIADTSYFSDSGELLISEGITITEGHLRTLHRRGLEKVYIKGDEKDEIEKIAEKDLRKPDELIIDEIPELPDDWEPKSLESIELKSIKKGKEGLDQLKNSELTAEIDSNIKKSIFSDRPIGQALKEKSKQISVDERTEEYKKEIIFYYAKALKTTTETLNGLADHKRIDGSEIKKTIEGFVKIFLTDRNILLNISGSKPTKDYLYHHSLNVCLLSINIAASANYSEKQIIEIGMGALLHDVGMLLIPKEIRFKKGKITQDEWFEIQKHPILGSYLLEKITNLPKSIPFMAYQVHEREDGRGYPKQRHGRLIHRFAKIVQVADVFEAMTSPRSYRKSYTPYEVISRLIKMVQQSLMPSDFTSAFLAYASLFPIGSLVQLSDHRIAKVVHTNSDTLSKPVVSILTDNKGEVLKKDKIYQEDLKDSSALQIIKALHSDYVKGIEIMDGF